MSKEIKGKKSKGKPFQGITLDAMSNWEKSLYTKCAFCKQPLYSCKCKHITGESPSSKPLKVADGSQPIKLFLMAFFGLATFLVLLKVVSLLEQIVINTSK